MLAEDAETERDGWQEVGAHRVELSKDVVDYKVSSADIDLDSS